MFDVRSDIAKALSWTERLSPQMDFAVAKSITDTVRMIEREMPFEAAKVFEGGATSWTQRGFYSTPARKGTPTGVVGVKDSQARYLQYQVLGGTRQPKGKALRLPQVMQLDGYGNLPPGAIRKLIDRAKAGKRATKAQGKKFGVSSKVDLFYGDPQDGRPPGLYKRVVAGKKHALIPLVQMPARGAKYTQRFDFYGIADRLARKEYAGMLTRAYAAAIRSAR